MRDRRLAIICPSMWPDMNMWGEAQRMYYLGNYLVEHGWQVTIISPRYGLNRNTLEEKEQKYTNLYLGSIKRKQKKGENFQESIQDKKIKKVKQRLSYVINQFGEWFYGEPDFLEICRKRNWVKKYQKEICQFINKENMNRVIISMPSFTFIQLGKIIKRNCRNTLLYYDYRDPWYLWKQKKNFAFFREQYYLKFADFIVGCSENLREGMIKEMRVDPQRIYAVYNGYSEQAWKRFEMSGGGKIYSRGEELNHKLLLVYTGTMSLSDRKDNYRNPSNLIAAIKNIPDVELFLVGVSKIEDEIVEQNVHYIGTVSQQKSFWYMMQSDVLISIHDIDDKSGEYLISGKFYDYMRSGKPILHIGKDNTLMADFMNKFKLGTICENHVEILYNEILRLVDLWKKGKLTQRLGSAQEIEQFSRECQNGLYEQILKTLYE